MAREETKANEELLTDADIHIYGFLRDNCSLYSFIRIEWLQTYYYGQIIECMIFEDYNIEVNNHVSLHNSIGLSS